MNSYLLRPSRGAKYGDQRVLCLSVCLSVRSHILEKAVQTSNFLEAYVLPVTVALSPSDGNAILHVYRTSGLWMTSCFPIVERIREDVYVSSSSPSGGTVDKVC